MLTSIFYLILQHSHLVTAGMNINPPVMDIHVSLYIYSRHCIDSSASNFITGHFQINKEKSEFFKLFLGHFPYFLQQFRCKNVRTC